MKISKYIAAGLVALGMGASSCTNLELTPNDPNIQTSITSAEQYYGMFAQLYAGLVIAGVNNNSDISVEDGGAGTYLRQLFNLQELCTDETVIGKNWNDNGIPELNNGTWGADNHWLYEAMSRFTFQINMCNEFLRTIDGANGLIPAEEIEKMKNEAHVVRDLSYYHMIDLFGRGPWMDVDHKIGSTPETKSRAELYALVVADLESVVDKITPASKQIYGRVSREGAKMLLAKFYLNAGVYTGTPQWQKCADVCKDIVASIPNLAPTYKYLFCNTNKKYVGNNEILWGAPHDANAIQTYGGTTYLAVGGWNANVQCNHLGYKGTGWGGLRAQPELLYDFDVVDASDMAQCNDKRMLFSDGGIGLRNDLDDMGDWGKEGAGLMCVKWAYLDEDRYDDGESYAHDDVFSSIDFPIFRLADTFLMLAECELNGVSCNGEKYFNDVRTRAGVETIPLTADNLLAERHRELYWECHRRTDLIRFGKFAGYSYSWQWKGGEYIGGEIDAYRTVYCIPTQFVPTLGQNEGYKM